MWKYETGTNLGARLDYVFVDEHNRHKRLKGKRVHPRYNETEMAKLTIPVMRACNGCRKRKIKCDAATTNTWPCSACTRLKLVCVPPTIGQDGDFVNEGMESAQEVGASSATSEPSHHAFPVPPAYRDPNQAPMGTMPPYDGMGMYGQFVHAPPTQPGMYNDMRSSPMVMQHQSYQQQPQVFPGPQPPHLSTPDRSVFAENDQSTADNLSDVLGELKIDESGIGMIQFDSVSLTLGLWRIATTNT